MRTVLVHLNVEVPAGDQRTAEEIGKAVEGAIEVGKDAPELSGLEIVVALVDEV